MQILDDGGWRPGWDTTRNGSPPDRYGTKVVDEAEVYYDLLVGCTTSVDIWETEYQQIFEGDNAVLEWVRGTGLRPILEGLYDIQREQFLNSLQQPITRRVPSEGGRSNPVSVSPTVHRLHGLTQRETRYVDSRTG